jgi:hypothetical protein
MEWGRCLTREIIPCATNGITLRRRQADLPHTDLRNGAGDQCVPLSE